MGFLKKKEALAIDPQLDAEDLLIRAELEAEPVNKHAYLTRAEELEPDNLKVQKALLLLGRLHERDPKHIDFSVIKSYLFHAFEHPEKHTEAEKERMARTFFDEDRLRRCLALSPDPDAFLRDYLEALGREYVHLFIASDSSHVPSLFGFSLKGSLPKYLAVPARDIIANILSSPHLNADEQRLLARQFYQAFHREVNGETSHLDRLMGPEICRALR